MRHDSFLARMDATDGQTRNMQKISYKIVMVRACSSFLEIKASVHKTVRALHMRHMVLQVAAPAVGVTDECLG